MFDHRGHGLAITWRVGAHARVRHARSLGELLHAHALAELHEHLLAGLGVEHLRGMQVTRDRGGIVRPVARIDHARVQRRRAARARRRAETRSSATGRGRDASARHNELATTTVRGLPWARADGASTRPRPHVRGPCPGGSPCRATAILARAGCHEVCQPPTPTRIFVIRDTSNNRFATGCQLATARARASAIFSSINDPPHERRRSDTNTPSPLQPTLYTSSDPRATFSPIDPAHLAPP